MKIADTFSDGQKRTWTVGECLGRGIWGRTYLVRDADGHERVLKAALVAADFAHEPHTAAEVARGCTEALNEQARLLEKGDLPFLPRLEAKLVLPDGRAALMLHRYPNNLGRRLEAGMPLTGLVQLVQRVCAALAQAGRPHGALRPSNVLLGDRGEIVLSDWSTPAVDRLLERLESHAPTRARWRPPEAEGRATSMWDTWALNQVLWQATMTRDAAPGTAHRLEAPVEGLDKVAVATLKDRALGRLASERTNPRFRARIADRLGAILNRGLSRLTEPSPPYRFADAPSLSARLEEVAALLAPRVEEVGRVLLASGADQTGTFQGGEAVSFSVSIGCTPGVSDHEDVVCGLQLVDLDAPDGSRLPVHDAKFRVTSHPSGRIRFQFDLPNVPPGRYRVRTAFSVKDSGQEALVADGRFEIRPPPGYVPPVAQDEGRGTMISLDRLRGRPSDPSTATPAGSPSASEPSLGHHLDDADEATTPAEASPPRRRAAAPAAPLRAQDHRSAGDRPSSADASDPGAEIIEGLFPRPIAPPDEDLQDDDGLEEIPVAQVRQAPRPLALASAPLDAMVEIDDDTEMGAQQVASVGASWSPGPDHAPRVAAPRGPESGGRPEVVAFAPRMEPGIGVPRAPQPSGPALGTAAPGPSIGLSARPSLAARSSSPPASHPSAGPMGGHGPGIAIASPAAVARPRPVPAPVPVESDLNDDWEAGVEPWTGLQGDGADFGIEHEAFPHAEGEDLPSWRRGELPFDARSIPGVNWLIERAQRDSLTALVVSVAGCFLLLVGCMVLLQTC